MFSLKGVTIVKPIVYGNMARYFGKKREEDGHTHQWTIYVKPYRNEVCFICVCIMRRTMFVTGVCWLSALLINLG